MNNNTIQKINNNGNKISKMKKPSTDFGCCAIDNIKLTTEKLKKYCQMNRFYIKEVL